MEAEDQKAEVSMVQGREDRPKLDAVRASVFKKKTYPAAAMPSFAEISQEVVHMDHALAEVESVHAAREACFACDSQQMPISFPMTHDGDRPIINGQFVDMKPDISTCTSVIRDNNDHDDVSGSLHYLHVEGSADEDDKTSVAAMGQIDILDKKPARSTLMPLNTDHTKDQPGHPVPAYDCPDEPGGIEPNIAEIETVEKKPDISSLIPLPTDMTELLSDHLIPALSEADNSDEHQSFLNPYVTDGMTSTCHSSPADDEYRRIFAIDREPVVILKRLALTGSTGSLDTGYTYKMHQLDDPPRRNVRVKYEGHEGPSENLSSACASYRVKRTKTGDKLADILSEPSPRRKSFIDAKRKRGSLSRCSGGRDDDSDDSDDDRDDVDDDSDWTDGDDIKCVKGTDRDHIKLEDKDQSTEAERKPLTVICPLCSKTFAKKSYLLKHQRRVHLHTCNVKGESDGQCQHCGHQHSDEGCNCPCSLNPRIYLCTVCGKVFKSSSILKEHMASHSSETPYQCTVCGKSFKTSNRLCHHKRVHLPKDQKRRKTDPKPYICSICGAKFTHRPLLREHLSIFKGHTSKNQCHLCDRIYDSTGALHRNVHTHEKGKPFQCDHCEFSTEFANKLKIHVQTHFAVRDKICTICGKMYLSEKYLYRHMDLVHSHDVSLSFLCTVCGTALKTKEGLKVHMELHSEETPHACPVCGKGFKTRGMMTTHAKLIHRSKDHKYKCEVCDKRLSTEITLKAHMLCHSDETPYVCKYCGNKFKRPNNLKSHMRTHLEDRNFECKLCGMTFKWKHILRNHMKKHDYLTPNEIEKTAHRPFVDTVKLEKSVSPCSAD